MLFHPHEWLLQRWNWKAAILASVLRAAIFFVSHLKAGRHAAVTAMLVEFFYRALTSGFWGAITQAFEGAEPPWLAAASALLLIPLLSHSLELLLLLLEHSSRLWPSLLSSLLFTALSTSFNLYAMRRGALLVGSEGRSFKSDLRRMPRLIAGFVAAGPKALFSRVRWLRFSYIRQLL